MIAGLKCGGQALNLTRANWVISIGMLLINPQLCNYVISFSDLYSPLADSPAVIFTRRPT
jgi:hypothetical protein